jgi:hypothetical protein
MDTKIFLAVPSNRGIKQLTAESLLKMIMFRPEIFSGVNVASEGYTIAENRNCLAARAIKSGATHMLFIDDDMVFPDDTAVRLLSFNKDIIGLVYHPRQVSSNNIDIFDGMFKVKGAVKDVPRDKPFKVDGCGTGILLINLDVFKKVPRPWFKFIEYDTGMVKQGEDFYFCEQARNVGYEIWADPVLKIGHIGDFVY